MEHAAEERKGKKERCFRAPHAGPEEEGEKESPPLREGLRMPGMEEIEDFSAVLAGRGGGKRKEGRIHSLYCERGKREESGHTGDWDRID